MIELREKTDLELKFIDLCAPIVKSENLYLYDLEYRSESSLLRLYIMNEETKAALIEDCVRIDRALTDPLNENEWVPETLTLEVSSPGIYRSLGNSYHFDLAIGEQVQVTTTEGIEIKGKKNHHLIANLVGHDEENLTLEKQGEEIKIPLRIIKKANVEPNI